MTTAQLVALVLALAVVVACVQLPLAHRRDLRRPRAWRLLVLLALQPLLAGALYLALFPPQHPVAAGTLTVLTGGAAHADAPAAGEGGTLLALPEARDVGDIERVPDLGTALRRHPGTTRVHVVGAGLVARDRDAARSVSILFEPPPLPRGLVRLAAPREIMRGAAFAIEGRVEGLAGGHVELLDPAGRRIDAMPLPDDGGFALRGVALEAGAASFGVRLLDAEGASIEQAQVPLWIDEAVAPRVLLLAGAPNPDTRALRRWLEDAGAQVQARIAIGGGLQLGGFALSDEALAGADLLVVDARAWSGLGEGGRGRVIEAVRGGLGLLLRADTSLPAATLRGLRAPGFAVEGGAGTQPWPPPAARVSDEDALRGRMGIGSRDAPFDLSQAGEAPPPLARRAWRVQGADATPFAPASDAPAGWWRGEGRGRIGLWAVTDSYAWPLHGRPDLYDELWSPAIATLARARANPLPVIDGDARVGQRLVVCGLPAAAMIESPDGARTQPIVDPASGERRCAGVWPQVAGWHRLRIGDAVRPFHVAAAADAHPGLQLAELREATLRLAAAVPEAAPGEPSPTAPGRAWPWFLAWLLLAALAWWFERSRLGLAAAVSQQDRPDALR